MTVPPIIPSRDPASSNNMGGMLATIHRKKMMKVDGQLPAIVISYNRTSNLALVRPLISLLMTNGTTTPRATIASVPVLALGGGGFTMTFPLKAGDKGWIEASDRDISLFMQSGSQAAPNTMRIHQFADGRFIPDSFAQYTFDSDDAEGMCLQSWDGTQKITINPTNITMKATNIALVATQGITLQAGTGITETAGTAIARNAESITDVASAAASLTGASVTLNTTGATGAKFTGPAVIMPDAIINGVTQSTHIHPGVQPGTGVSDGPEN